MLVWIMSTFLGGLAKLYSSALVGCLPINKIEKNSKNKTRTKEHTNKQTNKQTNYINKNKKLPMLGLHLQFAVVKINLIVDGLDISLRHAIRCVFPIFFFFQKKKKIQENDKKEGG